MAKRDLDQIVQEVDSWSEGEIRELASRLLALAESKVIKPPIDWESIRGILKMDQDPLEYQREIRAEWDERLP